MTQPVDEDLVRDVVERALQAANRQWEGNAGPEDPRAHAARERIDRLFEAYGTPERIAERLADGRAVEVPAHPPFMSPAACRQAEHELERWADQHPAAAAQLRTLVERLVRRQKLVGYRWCAEHLADHQADDSNEQEH